MWITKDTIDLTKLLEETEDEGTGACVIFLGTVRKNSGNEVVMGITYEAHIELSSQVLQRIEQEVEKEFRHCKCRVIHRIGYLRLGEVSVAIVVRAPHRTDAYKASRFVIEKVKKTVPIWKKEHLANNEEKWVEGHMLEDVCEVRDVSPDSRKQLIKYNT